MFEMALAEGSLVEVEEGMDEQALVDKVRGAITQLSEEYRTVVTMRYIDGFSPKEIARMLDSTENAVSVRLHRAVQKLKTALA